jgi:methyl-accepting chemotaxis protein
LDILTEIDNKNPEKKSRVPLILIAAIIFLIIVAFVGVSTFLSNKNAEKAKLNDLINQSKQTINQTALSITRSAVELEKSLYLIGKDQELQKLLKEDTGEARESILKLFKDYKDRYTVVENIFLGTEDKKMYVYPQVELPADYDPSGRPWYINALNNKEFTWSEPYIDAGKGAAVITLSLPVYNEKEITGVLSVDLNLDLMVEEIKNITLGSKGYMMITDQNGIVIVHPDRQQIGFPSQIGDLLKSTKEDTGVIRYLYQGVEETAIYSKIDKLNLNLIGLIKK